MCGEIFWDFSIGFEPGLSPEWLEIDPDLPYFSHVRVLIFWTFSRASFNLTSHPQSLQFNLSPGQLVTSLAGCFQRKSIQISFSSVFLGACPSPSSEPPYICWVLGLLAFFFICVLACPGLLQFGNNLIFNFIQTYTDGTCPHKIQ